MTGEKTPGEEIWEQTRGPHNRNVRRRLWREHRRFAHEGLMRRFAEDLTDPKRRREHLAEPNAACLTDVHPDAFALIAAYGIEYTAHQWSRHPKLLPKSNLCCYNSVVLMRSTNKELPHGQERAVYVEGLVWGEFALPMLHAWNARNCESRIAFDWTHYAGCQWSQYIGIPFTEEEYETIRRAVFPKSRRLVFIFHKQHFPRTRALVAQILERRTVA